MKEKSYDHDIEFLCYIECYVYVPKYVEVKAIINHHFKATFGRKTIIIFDIPIPKPQMKK